MHRFCFESSWISFLNSEKSSATPGPGAGQLPSAAHASGAVFLLAGAFGEPGLGWEGWHEPPLNRGGNKGAWILTQYRDQLLLDSGGEVKNGKGK